MIKKMAYISVLVSILSAKIFSIDLGVFQLSLFRMTIMAIILFMCFQAIQQNGIFLLNYQKENRYSMQFFIVWLLYSILTLGWIKDFEAWVRAVYFIALGVIYIIIYSKFFRTSDDILTAFRLIALLIIIHNLIGWYEVYTGNYIFLTADRIMQYAKNSYPVSMFPNTNNFATFMVFSVFIAYICAVNSRRITGKAVYVITMVSSTMLLIMTKSRANILGLILAVAVFIYLPMKKKRMRRYIIFSLMTLFVLISLAPYFIENIYNFISDNLSFNFSSYIGSDSIRLNLIKNGLHFLISTFGFGTGAGNIEYWMENYGIYYTGEIINMHNWWMEILTGYGIIIFALYILFYLNLLGSLYKTYKSSSNRIDSSISLGIICCMSGFLMGSISSSSNISSEWLWVFWALSIAFQGRNVLLSRPVNN